MLIHNMKILTKDDDQNAGKMTTTTTMMIMMMMMTVMFLFQMKCACNLLADTVTDTSCI